MMPLNDNIVNAITTEIEVTLKNPQIATRFVNKVLKEDIFDLLDTYCTVVYFPLENEDNNGFHINSIPDKSGKDQSFVFINTAQTVEKQVFTAAHELGHIWEIDSKVAKKLHIELSERLSEDIINRFAAELLMPKPEFENAMQIGLKEYFLVEDKKIRLQDLFRIIAQIMNQFLVPYKSVVIRLYELGYINETSRDVLLGEKDLSEKIIYATLQAIFKENGYQSLQMPTGRKYIAGLADLLDKADEKNVLPSEKINAMRKWFELPKNHFDEKVDQSLTIEA